MGKKRVAIIGEETEKKEKPKPSIKEEKVHIAGLKGGQRIKTVEMEPIVEETPKIPEAPEVTKKEKTPKPPRPRGKLYLAAKGKITSGKAYSLAEAIKLLKQTSITKFDGSAEAHFLVSKTGLKGEVSLPHFQAKTRKVEIASQETLTKIEAGKIDFDVLLTTPTMMPALAKYAKILGPKGLMPNPKAGTIVENPEKVAKNFEKPTQEYKTEAGAPLIHTVFGKVSQPEEELQANLQTLMKSLGRQNLKKLVVKSTMGPGIKVDLS